MILTPEEKKKFETQLKAFQNMLTDLTQKVSEAKVITPEILKEHEMAISTMKKLKNGFCPSCGAPGQSGTCAYCGTTLPTFKQEKPEDIFSKKEPVNLPKNIKVIDADAFKNADLKPIYISPEHFSNLKFSDDIAHKLRKLDIPDLDADLKISPTAKFANDFIKTESSWAKFEIDWRKIMEETKDFINEQNK